MTPERVIEIIRAEYEAHSMAGRSHISKPVLSADDGEDDMFTGMEVFDLEPTESVNDGRFKLQTGKWG